MKDTINTALEAPATPQGFPIFAPILPVATLPEEDAEHTNPMPDEVPDGATLIQGMEDGSRIVETNGPGPRPAGQEHNVLLWKYVTAPGTNQQFGHVLANFNARIDFVGWAAETNKPYFTLCIINNIGSIFMTDIYSEDFWNGETFERHLAQFEEAGLAISPGKAVEVVRAIELLSFNALVDAAQEHNRLAQENNYHANALADIAQELLNRRPATDQE